MLVKNHYWFKSFQNTRLLSITSKGWRNWYQFDARLSWPRECCCMQYVAVYIIPTLLILIDPRRQWRVLSSKVFFNAIKILQLKQKCDLIIKYIFQLICNYVHRNVLHVYYFILQFILITANYGFGGSVSKSTKAIISPIIQSNGLRSQEIGKPNNL
jgi:hypothetical protein